MAILGKLLRLFGYVFIGGLCLAMIGLAAVVLLSGSNNFTLDMIPWWTGRELAKWILCAGLAGLAITVLAARGRLPLLMLLCTATVLGVMVYGYYLTNLKYDNWEHFRTSLNMTGAALASFAGAVTGLFVKPRRAR